VTYAARYDDATGSVVAIPGTGEPLGSTFDEDDPHIACDNCGSETDLEE
jgi:hypothetical protein